MLLPHSVGLPVLPVHQLRSTSVPSHSIASLALPSGRPWLSVTGSPRSLAPHVPLGRIADGQHTQGWVHCSPDPRATTFTKSNPNPSAHSVLPIPVRHFTGLLLILWMRRLLLPAADKEPPVSTLSLGLRLHFANLRLEGQRSYLLYSQEIKINC